MSTDQWTHIRYLLPPRGSFWGWADDGQILSWAKGDTIAFREELLVVLRRLADTGTGLPPLAAVVLVLAATRDNWAKVGPDLISHAAYLAESGGGDTSSAVGVTLRAIGHRLVDDTHHIFDALQIVAGLPRELRQSPSSKANLADIVFGSETRDPRFDASAVHAELESQLDPTSVELMFSSSNFALRELVDALDALRTGLAGLDAGRIEMRLRTGLDSTVKPAEIDLGPADRARRLMNEPDEDPDVSAVTRIARGLLAAVAVPRPVGAPDDRPAGGVTDISNRGPLDRLLLSELAHDDLTLAVRVAVNEALYLQRETPPRQPPCGRTIFIDTGLRTWGVPRIFVTAVALALTATADDGGSVNVWRASTGATTAPVDLTTRAGLVEHLASLDGRAHFGESLQAFVTETDQPTDAADPFLVTHEDVLDDPDFQKAMSENGPETAYAAAVNRDGSFRLWHLSAAGRRLVRKAAFDLEKLLEAPKRQSRRKPSPLISPVTELPEIFFATPFPLRLPPTSRIVATAVHADAGVVGITQDRRLLHWDQLPGKGPIQLSARLPKGSVRFLTITAEKEAVAVIREDSTRGQCFTIVARLDSGIVDIQWIDPQPAKTRFACHAGMFYIIHDGVVTALQFGQSKPIATINLGSYRWMSGRCFKAAAEDVENGWSPCALLNFDGARLVLESINNGNKFSGVLFEPTGGPFAGHVLNARSPGIILDLNGKPPLEGWRLLDEFHFSDARQSVRGRSDPFGTPARFAELDFRVAEPRWRDCPPNPPLPASEIGPPVHWMPGRLRTRFEAIAIDHAGAICLRTARNREQVSFVTTQPKGLLMLRRQDTLIADDRWKLFRPMDPASPDQRWLSVASWPDGSEAFLDRRGLLHLRSSDEFTPEMSLTLPANDQVSAWRPGGKAVGRSYFFDGNPNTSPGDVLKLLDRFAAGLK